MVHSLMQEAIDERKEHLHKKGKQLLTEVLLELEKRQKWIKTRQAQMAELDSIGQKICTAVDAGDETLLAQAFAQLRVLKDSKPFAKQSPAMREPILEVWEPFA